MSGCTIRPATLRDARSIAEIHVAAWQAAFRGLVPEAHLTSLSIDKRLAFWREAIEYAEPQVQVAFDGATAVGFVGYDRSRDPRTPATTGELWAIYVRPTTWGQGAGLALWDAARDGLIEEGCTEVTVWLPLRNERALRFHELAGFRREIASAKTVEIGGVKVEEIRLRRALG